MCKKLKGCAPLQGIPLKTKKLHKNSLSPREIFEGIFKFTLNLKDSFRIFIVASTPTIFLFFASLIVNYRIPGGVISYVALLSVYYSLAIISIRSMSGKMVHA